MLGVGAEPEETLLFGGGGGVFLAVVLREDFLLLRDAEVFLLVCFVVCLFVFLAMIFLPDDHLIRI